MTGNGTAGRQPILLVAGINVTLTAFIIIGAPVTVTQILGLPNQFMGFAEGALALGGLTGGILVGVLAKRLTLRQAPVFLFVAALALLPIAVVLGTPMDPLVAYGVLVASLFACMACATMFSIQGVSFIQLETPSHLVGKVIALAMAMANCAQPGSLCTAACSTRCGATWCRWRWVLLRPPLSSRRSRTVCSSAACRRGMGRGRQTESPLSCPPPPRRWKPQSPAFRPARA